MIFSQIVWRDVENLTQTQASSRKYIGRYLLFITFGINSKYIFWVLDDFILHLASHLIIIGLLIMEKL